MSKSNPFRTTNLTTLDIMADGMFWNASQSEKQTCCHTKNYFLEFRKHFMKKLVSHNNLIDKTQDVAENVRGKSWNFLTMYIMHFSPFFMHIVFLWRKHRASTVGSKIIRALAIIFVIFFSGLIASFYHLVLVTNSIKPKDYGLANIYLIQLH